MISLPFDPVALRIGPVVLRWYGIFIMLAVFWLIFWMWWQIRRGAKLSIDTVLTMALVAIPSGVVLARLLHVIDNVVVAKLHPELAASGQVFDYLKDPARIIGGSGLTAYGAVLGAALGVWVYGRVRKMQLGYVFDLLAPGVIMAQAIGRVGCLFNGCCYGVATDLPWGVTYTNPDSLGFFAVDSHPTVPYEIVFNVIAFGVLFKLRGKLKPDGALFALYLALYSAWRIGIDFLRDGSPFFLGLHQAQFIGMVVLLITVPWMAKNMRLAKTPGLAEIPSDSTPSA